MAETKKKNIYETISAVMSEIGAIGKTSKNQQQGFMFRGIDAVMNTINPALVRNNLFIVPEVLEQTREERTSSRGGNLIYSICKIKYTFYAEDGSSISAIVIGEGMDSGDKATNKAMAIAFKYACFQVFCIPTEEMVDPDMESHEVKPRSASSSSATKKATTGGVKIVTNMNKEQEIAPKGGDGKVISAESRAIRQKFVAYCNSNNVDAASFGLNNNSTDQDFENALLSAMAQVKERDGDGQLPFPIE